MGASLSLSLSFLYSCFVQLKQGSIPLHTPTCVLLGPHCDLRWVLGAPWTPQVMCMCMCMCMCRCRYSVYVCVCVGVGVGVSVYVYVYVYVHSSACGHIWWPKLWPHWGRSWLWCLVNALGQVYAHSSACGQIWWPNLWPYWGRSWLWILVNALGLFWFSAVLALVFGESP